MSDILKQLTKKKKELDKYIPLKKELQDSLNKWFDVELTYSSNAIEGNTLSRIETTEVIERGVSAVISGKPLKDQLEAVNHAKAICFIKSIVKQKKTHQNITEVDIRAIHKLILTGIDDEWVGRYRQIDIFIRGSNVEFPSPSSVPYKMKEFIEWLEGQRGKHPVRVASDAHFQFVSIHPFIDGNGRTARLLMNLILIFNNYPITVIRNEDRIQYLNALEVAQKTGNLKAFYKLIELAVDRSLDIYINAAKGKSSKLLDGKERKKEKLLKIGELAQATRETNATIRYWMKEGLLEVAGYTKGGYQLYKHDMINRVKDIRRLQKERLSLIEIKNRLIERLT